VIPKVVLGVILRLVLGIIPSLGYIYSDNSSALGYGRKAFKGPSGVRAAKF